MKITFTIDPSDRQVMVVYFGIAEGKVARTVEIADGECYIDEDEKGNPIGIEMLRPGHLEILVNQVAKKYHIPAISEAVNSVRTALACA